MKHTSKKSSLLLCGLGALASFAVFTGSVHAIQIGGNKVEIDGVQQHISRLYSLYVSESAGLIVNNNRLNITKGFIIGDGSSNSSDTTILGGTNNKIGSNSDNSGIAGGENNTINGYNSVIGGGKGNTISAHVGVIAGGKDNTTHVGVIAGGKDNTITNSLGEAAFPVIAGGYKNTVDNGGTIIGGAGNTANGSNSLALGKNAEAEQGSFAWNGKAKQFSAYIGAENGVLIGTTTPKEGINLVVNGTMSIGGDLTVDAEAGEMRSVNGCFYAYDGQNWHIVGQYRNECGDGLAVSNNCKFGNVLLQVGDKVEAYPQIASTNCVSQTVVCGENGDLRGEGSDNTERYPYCYKTAN